MPNDVYLNKNNVITRRRNLAPLFDHSASSALTRRDTRQPSGLYTTELREPRVPYALSTSAPAVLTELRTPRSPPRNRPIGAGVPPPHLLHQEQPQARGVPPPEYYQPRVHFVLPPAMGPPIVAQPRQPTPPPPAPEPPSALRGRGHRRHHSEPHAAEPRTPTSAPRSRPTLDIPQQTSGHRRAQDSRSTASPSTPRSARTSGDFSENERRRQRSAGRTPDTSRSRGSDRDKRPERGRLEEPTAAPRPWVEMEKKTYRDAQGRLVSTTKYYYE